jgi:hypothetical protein
MSTHTGQAAGQANAGTAAAGHSHAECVGENETMLAAAKKLPDRGFGAMPIGEDDRLKGMLTDVTSWSRHWPRARTRSRPGPASSASTRHRCSPPPPGFCGCTPTSWSVPTLAADGKAYPPKPKLLQALDNLAARGDAELAVDRGGLALDRVLGDVEPFPDLGKVRRVGSSGSSAVVSDETPTVPRLVSSLDRSSSTWVGRMPRSGRSPRISRAWRSTTLTPAVSSRARQTRPSSSSVWTAKYGRA